MCAFSSRTYLKAYITYWQPKRKGMPTSSECVLSPAGFNLNPGASGMPRTSNFVSSPAEILARHVLALRGHKGLCYSLDVKVMYTVLVVNVPMNRQTSYGS